jgi:site-specific DNA-methyltransferase (adenine-specific)
VEAIDGWKVFIGNAHGGAGHGRDKYPVAVMAAPFLGIPGSVSTETYVFAGPFETELEANSVISYLSCRLTRFLILLHKPSQHATRKVYSFVPTQDWSRPWSDEDLYAKYGLTPDEVAFIEKMIRPMEV